MDREFLFRHLEQHYLSKSEMISRIPLGMQADAVWRELLDRRRSRGTILALTDGRERPFWYVTTDKMVAASEKIIEALFENETDYDPYLAPPPVSTLEEVFYTSYVEGSQITMQDAMAFLQSGKPARDIEEQLIINNRQAGSFASANLYRRIDEGFLKDLAFTLTEGMDTGGGDLRTEDAPEVPSMTGGSFILPPADRLPDKVRELAHFLADPAVHPLIKASAAQAWAFCIRPFPDGNERLGRILSSIILLRSGYTFFSDISLSALIARKGYAYYRAMDELMREENNGDMTYFMEYFLELLSRAVDERSLRKLRSAEEERAAEIELAKTPLSAGDPPPNSADTAAAPERTGAIQEAVLSDTVTEMVIPEPVFLGEDPPDPSFPPEQEGGDTEALRAQKAFDLLKEYSKEPGTLLGRFSSYMIGLLHKGMMMFNLRDAAEDVGSDVRKLSRLIIRFKKEGVLTDYKKTKKGMIYQILAFHPDCPPLPADPRYNLLMLYAENERMNACPAARYILSLIGRGVFHFTNKELSTVFKSDRSKHGATIKLFKLTGIIDNGNLVDGNKIYRILVNVERIHAGPARPGHGSFQDEHDNNVHTDQEPDQETLREEHDGPGKFREEDYDSEVLETIEVLRGSYSSKDRRLGEILFSALSKGEVTYNDYADRGEEARFKIDLFLALQIGLVEKTGHHRYRILKHLRPDLTKLTKAQKRVASEIYDTFGMGRFSTEMVLANLKYADGTVFGYLHNFTLLKILDCQKDGVNQYRFRISPKEHPECFEVTA